MTVEIGKMRPVRAMRPARSAAPPVAAANAVKGYGHFVFWPFAIVIVALGVMSRDWLLMGTSVAFASAMVWLGGKTPYLAFACFYQAMIGMSGGAYLGIYGHYPGGVAANEYVPRALALLQLALVVVTATYWLIVREDTPGDVRLGQSRRMLKISPYQLFAVLLILFIPEWLRIPLQPSSTGGFRQLVLHLVNFRYVLFALFLINVLRANKRRFYLMLLLLFVYIALPLSVTGSAGWSSLAIMTLMLTAGCLVFTNVRGGARLTPAIIGVGAAAIVFLISFGLIWEGGMKLAWRTTLSNNAGSSSMVARISQFGEETQGVIKNFDMSYSLEQLTSRMSSGEGFCSLVLRNVPRSIPFANGERSLAALQNLVPRILFPGKQDLGGDSWLVRKYANIVAAGDESGTSIGLGYVTELYVDLGARGVVLGSIFLGMVLAIGKLLFRRFAGGGDIGNASIAVILYVTFTVPDASLTKMVASMVFGLVVFTLLGHLTYRYLYVPYGPAARASRGRPRSA